MSYVDGFVIPLPEDKVDAYREMSAKAGKIWMEHGALAYKECVADDINSEHAKGFVEASRAQDGETVVFAYILYKSRAHRDEVNAKVMSDPRMQEMCPGHNEDAEMPFDVNRMAFGGFRAIVDL